MRIAKEMGMRVVGYTRVSDDDWGDDAASLEVQEAEIAAFCRSRGLEPIGMFRDRGLAPRSIDRPGLAGALCVLDLGTAAGIVVARLDRLTRSIAELGVLLEGRFGGRGARHLFSVADEIDTRTAAGRLALNVLASVSGWERLEELEELESEAPRLERSGAIPYGWELSDDRRALVKNRREQQVLRWICQWWNRGNSLRSIARALNRLQIPTKTGKAGWSHSAVAAILKRTLQDRRLPVLSRPRLDAEVGTLDSLSVF